MGEDNLCESKNQTKQSIIHQSPRLVDLDETKMNRMNQFISKRKALTLTINRASVSRAKMKSIFSRSRRKNAQENFDMTGFTLLTVGQGFSFRDQVGKEKRRMTRSCFPD